MTFRELHNGLRDAIEQRYVTENIGPDDLRLYCYTQSCTFDKAWNEYTVLARGLVLDHRDERVAATPFPKFFNASERAQTIPDLPFEVYDKVDGSLIILFRHRDRWHATTKGAFNTVQAKQALKLLPDLHTSWLSPHATYLLEYVGPDNRIIIDYPRPELHLLSGYWEDGCEFADEMRKAVSEMMGWAVVPRRQFGSFAEIIETTKGLPASQEGFVVRFSDGLRLKIKGDEYCRIHALVSRITPIGVWEILRSGDDIDEIKQKIPEEFWTDFDAIIELINKRCEVLLQRVDFYVKEMGQLSDKQVGLSLGTVPEEVRPFIFPYRKAAGNREDAKLRTLLYRHVRPDGNRLDGYVPSYMMGRLQDES
jgi:RNA ligase